MGTSVVGSNCGTGGGGGGAGGVVLLGRLEGDGGFGD